MMLGKNHYESLNTFELSNYMRAELVRPARFNCSWMLRCGSIAVMFLLFFSAYLLAADATSGSNNTPEKHTATTQEAGKKGGDAAKGDSTPADASADFKHLLSQWQAALTDMAQVQANRFVTTATEREVLEPQYAALVLKANAMLGPLQSAAEKAFSAGDTNPEIGKLLMTIAVGDVRKDDYAEALRLAKLLIEHKYPDEDVYRIAATSAFVLMDLDDAQKYLEALGDGKIPNEPELQSLAAEIAHYRPLWQREQKLRAAEAKANDLPRVKLQTNKGDMVVELFENEAPNTVANFISLVEKGLYDGTEFHRVLPGFMAQGGDPLSKDPEKNKGNIGKGGPGYTIADEFHSPNRRDHFAGTLSMAHTQAPNSAGSQFFITFAPTPHLDGGYTAFGRVIEGMDVLSKLQRIDPDKELEHPSGQPPDKIVKAEVLRKRDHPYEPKIIEQH
jgi:cyclophilin family peptidyl-prolyl cis-trans isomerase